MGLFCVWLVVIGVVGVAIVGVVVGDGGVLCMLLVLWFFYSGI